MSVYKKSLHAFFLRVHPDFFARSNPEWQKTNEQSIAKLNELLDWAKNFKQGEHRPPPANKISFKFYRRPEHDAPSDLTQTDQANDLSSQQQTLPSQLSAQFDLPKTFTTSSSASAALVERSVNKFLRDLLRKAGCLDSVAGAASNAQDERLAKEELMTTSDIRSKRATAKKPNVQTLMDAASQAVEETVMSGSGRFLCPSVEELVEEDQILFMRDLTPLECAAATQRLAQLLPQMRYEEWMHVPIIFSKRPYKYEVGLDIKGTMTIPWDFELYPFLDFLREDGSKVRDARAALQETARKVESLISDISKECDLDDVLITCTHRQAIPFMELFAQHTHEFNLIGISGVTLEIGEHFAYRENGVIVVDSNCLDLNLLRKKMEKFAALMPELQKRYETAKKMLNEIQYLKDRFSEDVRPAAVDCETTSEPYFKRLEWMKELASVAPQLAQYDWSDVQFALGPLSLDWENRIMTLPSDFDGQAFVRYLDDVRMEKKETMERELNEYEALRKHADSLDEMSKNTQKHTSDVVNNNNNDAEHQEKYLQLQQSNNENQISPEGKGSRKKKNSAASSRPEDKWKEEYLVSSTGSTHARGDRFADFSDFHELVTERPLAPDMNAISSEQDATDHLEWEGFYNKRHVPQSTDRDVEEIENAFLKTNEKHRAQAVRDLVEKLDEKYGLSENRYRKMTLGDAIGINNPRIRSETYPTVAKGTYAGDDPKY